MRNLACKQIRCAAVAALILVWCLVLPAAAKGPGRPASDIPMNPEGQPLMVLPKVQVTIEKKSLKTVTTSIGDVYALFEETIIVGSDGKQLAIRKMPVPCKAELVYTTEKGVRKALRIGITSVSENATTNWTSKDPG